MMMSKDCECTCRRPCSVCEALERCGGCKHGLDCDACRDCSDCVKEPEGVRFLVEGRDFSTY